MVKLIVSSKAVILEERINKELGKLEEDGYVVDDISSNISFAGERGYMILCQIRYHKNPFAK